jgi:hypothetical protein
MNNLIHKNPLTAWKHLCDHGGIELDGRDEGLDQRIQQRINPEAASFNEALVGTTMEMFARAFFEAIHPYVAMFKDILDFFRSAEATEGKDQWVLRVDEFDLDLEHFRKEIATWIEVAKTTEYYRAVDWHGAWDIIRLMRTRDLVESEVMHSIRQRSSMLPVEIQDWVVAYNQGEYPPLPVALLPGNIPQELRSCSLIVEAALGRLGELGLDRQQLMAIYQTRKGQMERADALDFWSLAQNETDFWLRTFVIAISAAAQLDTVELSSLGTEISAFMDDFPLKPFEASVSVNDLDSVLSLPIWKKRYELYSVWIATEVIRALRGHEIQLHHDHGRIEFAFRETLIATILSSPGPFTLISEKRVPLDHPRGEGRKAGVQPDHALWTVQQGHDECRLVVEVKHYKRAATRKFVDVFEDYARAFPAAQIYLVNHGPTGRAVYDVSNPLGRRCHSIERLTSSNHEARQKLAKAVRECVGEPIQNWPRSSENADSATVLMLDVSASMRDRLRTSALEAFVKDIAQTEHPRELVAVDTAIVGSWAVTQAGFQNLLRAGGGSTALSQPMHLLLQSAGRIVVVTDQDGLDTLGEFVFTVPSTQSAAPPGIFVRVCTGQ